MMETNRLLIRVTLLCILVSQAQGDYVETAPRPGAPLPPEIPLGECPLVFLESDVQHAKQSACLSSTAASIATSGNLPTSCCGQIAAVLFAARVRYANDTGRLLLPQASADACIQNFNASLIVAAIPFLDACGISSGSLSEETGQACRSDLTTVYDFWSATNHTYPGTVGQGCYGGGVGQCTLCTTLVAQKVLSIGASTTALLSTLPCQDLAQVAMTAAAYPLVVANGISQCLHAIDIGSVPLASKCTDYNWQTANLTSVIRSCGPQQIRPDRCCDLIVGAFGQQDSLLFNRTGRPLNQAQAEVCIAEFQAALAPHGVPSTILATCHISPAPALMSVGCYNYTTPLQRIPSQYLDEIAAVCGPNKDCSACQSTLFAIADPLANTTDVNYLSPCRIMIALQSSASLSTPEDITAWDNCYYDFPPGLELDPPIPLPKRSSSSFPIGAIAGICSAIGVLLLIALVVCAFAMRYRSQKNKKNPGPNFATLSRISSLRTRARGQRLQIVSKKQLERATKNFDESRLLGTGGSGRVYVGELNGEVVAIKQAVLQVNKNGAKEAWNEIATLALYRHRHLVFLKGCSLSGPQCSLVYEFMEQGSLDDHLYPARDQPTNASVQKRFLDWPTRAKIALGTARGLAYLHEECKPQCIHRDVKPSNILLTHDFEAKLSDFGLARLTSPDDTHVTTAVAGTWGFLSPEYIATGKLTDKSDVYSFGVVLLALVSGRRPQMPDEIYLPELAWIFAERNELGLLIDPRLEGDRKEHAESMDRMTRVALLCVHNISSFRPSARQCADMLVGNSEVPPLPKRPVTLYTIASVASSESGQASTSLTGQQSSTRTESTFKSSGISEV